MRPAGQITDIRSPPSMTAAPTPAGENAPRPTSWWDRQTAGTQWSIAYLGLGLAAATGLAAVGGAAYALTRRVTRRR